MTLGSLGESFEVVVDREIEHVPDIRMWPDQPVSSEQSGEPEIPAAIMGRSGSNWLQLVRLEDQTHLVFVRSRAGSLSER